MTKLFSVAMVFGAVMLGSATAAAQDLDMSVQLVGAAWVDLDRVQDLVTDEAHEFLGDEAFVIVTARRETRMTTLHIVVFSDRIGSGNVYALRRAVEATTRRSDITIPTVNGRPWRRGDRIAAL